MFKSGCRGMGTFSHDNKMIGTAHDLWMVGGARNLCGNALYLVPRTRLELPLHRTINFCFHPITPPEFRLWTSRMERS